MELYKALNREGIEIPYSKLHVNVVEMPAAIGAPPCRIRWPIRGSGRSQERDFHTLPPVALQIGIGGVDLATLLIYQRRQNERVSHR